MTKKVKETIIILVSIVVATTLLTSAVCSYTTGDTGVCSAQPIITPTSIEITTGATTTMAVTQAKVMEVMVTQKLTRTTTEVVITTESDTIPKSLGTFKITVYTPQSDSGKWGYATASGVRAQHLTTCAVDPNVIPLGSTIKVNGMTLRAVDTGSMVKGKVIDIFYDGTTDEALNWISDFGTKHTVTLIDTEWRK